MLEGVAVVAILLASAGALFRDFSEQLHLNEALISIITAVIAGLIGLSSVYLARIAKKIPNKPRIFLSYSHKDEDIASKLREAIINEGAFVWSYNTNYPIGQDPKATIASAIESSNSVVLMIFSPMSASIQSELDAALEKKVPVLVVMPTTRKLPANFTAKQVFSIDVTHPNFEAIAAELVHATEGRSPSEAVH